ncbi:hypothetical protein MSAN_01787900 [Mycena sanguinolenta]|uniref:F-box domain-containing protein n=1 Tax=Mycena sanguinolenta TaxID=230812 RepID=A0A8H7CS67_9AGAR|nr:hypothetical protein MSAN_01787900 [Mycena sanguinolenta]
MSLSNSPFANRLNTNYVPSDSEILEIRSLLVDPTEEIARIDAQIAEMELALVQLKEKRGLLQKPIDAHKALISPMRLIPQDILLEIFCSCLPREHNALIDPNEAPLLLGRISRHWRDVAYSSPMLWSSMHIPSPDLRRMPPNILLELERIVEAWLERSATCPLSISLVDHTDYLDSDIKKHPLMLQLLAVSQRLRHLTLSGDAVTIGPFLQLGPEELPQLKSSRIRYLSSYSDFPSILQIPTLEDVALCTVGSTDPLSLSLPWSRLTRLRLECYSHWTEQGPDGGLNLDGALDILRKCPNLEHCEIRVTRYSEHSGLTRSPPSIIMPQLHTLSITGWEFQLQKWISELVAPNLRSLRIGEDFVPPPPPSSCGRFTVDIDLNRFTSAGLHDLLQSFPMTSHFRVFSSRVAPPDPTLTTTTLDEEFIALFCTPHNLCAMLTDIHFESPSAGFSDKAALAFIKARMAMPIPLRRFRAQFLRPMELDIISELQSYISDGLQVFLDYPPPLHRFNAEGGLHVPGSLAMF